MLSKKNERKTVSKGKSGDITKLALLRLNEILDLNPGIVIILFGGNDHLEKIPKKETFNNLGKIIETLQKNETTVLLLGMRDGILKDNYSKEFENLSKKYKVPYISDVLSGILGNKKYMSDQVHPNDEGYKIISNRIYPVLKKIIY